MDQVKHVIASMPTGTEIERRDRAVVALTLLTGARHSAIASLKLKHIGLPAQCVYQDAREVKTKFSKTFTTDFFQVGDEISAIVADWVNYLREDKRWGKDDPLFPATRTSLDSAGHFEASGLTRKAWSSAAPIREIFRKAFNAAGVSYFKPHSLRTTLARFGEATCRTPEEFKAWSQNLGHEEVLTTFRSYGEVESRRKSEIIRSLRISQRPELSNTTELAKATARELRNFEEVG